MTDEENGGVFAHDGVHDRRRAGGKEGDTHVCGRRDARQRRTALEGGKLAGALSGAGGRRVLPRARAPVICAGRRDGGQSGGRALGQQRGRKPGQDVPLPRAVSVCAHTDRRKRGDGQSGEQPHDGLRRTGLCGHAGGARWRGRCALWRARGVLLREGRRAPRVRGLQLHDADP